MNMTNNLTRQIIHLLVAASGIGLMIGGAITGKHGATAVGLIVAAVNVQQWMQWNKNKTKDGESSPS